MKENKKGLIKVEDDYEYLRLPSGAILVDKNGNRIDNCSFIQIKGKNIK